MDDTNNCQRNKQKTNELMIYTCQEAGEYKVVEHKLDERQVEYDQQIEMEITHEQNRLG